MKNIIISVWKFITKSLIFPGSSDSKTEVKENLKGEKKLCCVEHNLHSMRPLFHINRFLK
jgi:hypothetical protein